MDLFGSNKTLPEATELDGEFVDDIRSSVAEHGEVLNVRPYRDDGDLRAAKQLLSSIHEVEESGGLRSKNDTPPTAFEPYFADDAVGYRFAPTDEHVLEELERLIPNFYRDADVTRGPAEFVPMREGQHMAAARLSLADSDYFKPIKHFEISPEEFETDPYGAIIPEMIGNTAAGGGDVATVVQVLIRPAWSNHPRSNRKNWYHGVDKTAKQLRKGEIGWRPSAVLEGFGSALVGGDGEDIDHTKTRETTSAQKQAADIVADQRGEKGYHFNVRVAAVADSADEAIERVEDTAGMYRRFYTSVYEQGFEPIWYDEQEARDIVRLMAKREWIDRDMILSAGALAGVCHIPTTLATPEIDYSRTSGSGSTPSEAPAFESFEEETGGSEERPS
ncbi:hypothetical protein [Halococcus sp. AFM35]|uniref:hypothetical protein n=1 Tax=Halococcus sp. AFM35 TaxID=3421653 RepID=UPI003EBB660D